MADRPTILVVDDESRLRELYAAFLGDRYEVRTAAGGEAAMAEMDTGIDAVVLDRRMPELSGDEVLERIRERGFEVPVLVITGVDPGADIVSLPLDDYLTKPADTQELRDRIETLLALSAYDDEVRECYALAAKRRAIRESDHGADMEDEGCAELRERLDRLAARLGPSLQELGIEVDADAPEASSF